MNILLVALGYLMGSICSAVIVCRLFGLPDPREEGSRNPGATNVLRLAGKQYAALVMIADLLKGTIPILVAKILEADTITISFTALAAVVGHMFPIFFGFKGGKGVATAIGALLGLHFITGIMVAATWLLVAKFSRYSSLASIIAIILAPFYVLLLTKDVKIVPPLFIIVILILFKHRNNITRLIDGVEPKIKLKSHVIEEIIPPPTQRTDNQIENPEVKEHLSLLNDETSVKKIPSTKPKTKNLEGNKGGVKKAKSAKLKTKKPDNNKKSEKKTVKKSTTNKTKVTKIKEE